MNDDSIRDGVRRWGPRYSSLYQKIAVALCLAKGSHVCGNSYPPVCMEPEADSIMSRVDALLLSQEES